MRKKTFSKPGGIENSSMRDSKEYSGEPSSHAAREQLPRCIDGLHRGIGAGGGAVAARDGMSGHGRGGARRGRRRLGGLVLSRCGRG